MSDAKDNRYFYTDGPSPLHEARNALKAKQTAALKLVEELTADMGATAAVGSDHIAGFVFVGRDDALQDPALRFAGRRDDKGNKIYVPKRTTAEGRALYARMQAIRVPGNESILDGTGLSVMRIQGRYMARSVAGWYGTRIFVLIPAHGDGDDFPKIPEYLTECERWEMEKFVSEFNARTKKKGKRNG